MLKVLNPIKWEYLGGSSQEEGGGLAFPQPPLIPELKNFQRKGILGRGNWFKNL